MQKYRVDLSKRKKTKMYHKNNFIDEVEEYHPHGKVDENMQTPLPVAIQSLIDEVKPASVTVAHYESHAWQEVYYVIDGPAQHLLRVHYNNKDIISSVTTTAYGRYKGKASAQVQKMAMSLENKSIFRTPVAAPTDLGGRSHHEEFLHKALESLRENGFSVLSSRSCSAYHLKLRVQCADGKEGNVDLYFNVKGEHGKTKSNDFNHDTLKKVCAALPQAVRVLVLN